MNFYVEDIVATTELILLNLIRSEYSKMFSKSEARAAIFVDESTRNLHTNELNSKFIALMIFFFIKLQ